MDNNTMKFFKKYQNDKIDVERLEQAKKKAKNLGIYSSELLIMISMIGDILKGKYKVKKAEVAVFIGAIIYVLAPVDAVPDFIPFVGFLDDIAVITYVSKKYAEILSKYKEFILCQN